MAPCDKEVLSCVPQFEWVQVLKCENTDPTPMQCGFNAISAVRGANGSEVDVTLTFLVSLMSKHKFKAQLKNALYDVARWYSANPHYVPTDENEWYEYTVKPSEVLHIEQQVAHCGDYASSLRIYNLTIRSTSGALVSERLWTPPEVLEGMATTDANKPATTIAMTTTMELTSTALTTSFSKSTTSFLTTTVEPSTITTTMESSTIKTTMEPTTTEEPTTSTAASDAASRTSEIRTTESATPSSTGIVQETAGTPTTTELLDVTSTAIPLLDEAGFWRRWDSLAVVFSTVFALLSLTSLLLALAVWRYKRSERTGRYDVESVRFTKSGGGVEVLRKPTPIPGVVKHEPHQKRT
ncbi:hypothetical protein AAVH_21930 [Aphelenchoides avenae]|nr:hypothetical protein AAVH_21930 [Aphelenchus avenae]